MQTATKKRRRAPVPRAPWTRIARAAAPLFFVPVAVFSACSSSSPETSGSSSATSTSSSSASSTSSSSSSGAIANPGPVASHSSSIAVSADGSTVYVVNADVDSVSVIDTATSKLTTEIALGSGPPAVDATGHYTPNVMPRALALSPGRGVLYVTGERSSSVFVIDLKTNKVTKTIAVGSQPAGVLVSADESWVYVACSNQNDVVKIDAGSGTVAATATISDGMSPLGNTILAAPWALGWSADKTSIYVTHLISPYVSVLNPSTLAQTSLINIPDVGSRGNKLLANGQARGLYDVVARPGSSGEVWVTHLMLAVDTPETYDTSTTLDFDSTVFPTVSVLNGTSYVSRMSTNAMSIPSDTGAFGDIVSGPHALEFTPDGSFALMLDSASEDVLAIDANGKVEAQLLRPLTPPGGALGHMQEGIVVSADGKHAYIDERNTSDVVVIDIAETSSTITLTVAGPAIPRLGQTDPMPTAMRQGQFLFNTANTEAVSITQNNWIACASCHVEGGSDAVTWKFLQGPRDTPTNAGGKSDTGFLQRTADRRTVFDYWQTVEREQGGDFGGNVSDAGVATAPTDTIVISELDAIQAYVDYAIPIPVPPQQDATMIAAGKALFNGKAACSSCHPAPTYTNSALNNAQCGQDGGCDLEGTLNLEDVGTCVTTGTFPDVPHTDEDGNLRAACKFNVPSLRGLATSAPYLHDGSSATLYDLIANTKGKMGNTAGLSTTEIDQLVAFLRSL